MFFSCAESPQRQLGLEAVRSVVAREKYEDLIDVPEKYLELDRRHCVDFPCRFLPFVLGHISKGVAVSEPE